ncbi:unnamed protein product [Urochloa humidicola]
MPLNPPQPAGAPRTVSSTSATSRPRPPHPSCEPRHAFPVDRRRAVANHRPGPRTATGLSRQRPVHCSASPAVRQQRRAPASALCFGQRYPAPGGGGNVGDWGIELRWHAMFEGSPQSPELLL